MSLQLNFSDQLVLIDLREYDEASLLTHVKACHTIADQLPSHFDISLKEEEKTTPRANKIYQDNSSDTDGDSVLSRGPTFIMLSPAVIDSVRCACYYSAKLGVVQAVQRMSYSVQGLIDLLFLESKGSTWIGSSLAVHILCVWISLRSSSHSA